MPCGENILLKDMNYQKAGSFCAERLEVDKISRNFIPKGRTSHLALRLWLTHDGALGSSACLVKL